MKTFFGKTFALFLALTSTGYAQTLRMDINTREFNDKTSRDLGKISFRLNGIDFSARGDEINFDETKTCEVEMGEKSWGKFKVESTSPRDVYGECDAGEHKTHEYFHGEYHDVIRRAKDVRSEWKPYPKYIGEANDDQIACVDKTMNAAKAALAKIQANDQDRKFLRDLRINQVTVFLTDTTGKNQKKVNDPDAVKKAREADEQNRNYGFLVHDDPVFRVDAVLNSEGMCLFATADQLVEGFHKKKKQYDAGSKIDPLRTTAQEMVKLFPEVKTFGVETSREHYRNVYDLYKKEILDQVTPWCVDELKIKHKGKLSKGCALEFERAENHISLGGW